MDMAAYPAWKRNLFHFFTFPTLFFERTSKKSQIKREAVIALYSAKVFLPGFFDRKAFQIFYLLMRCTDVFTDFANGARAFTDQNISLAARSTHWAMFLNLLIVPMITGRVTFNGCIAHK